MNDNTFITEMRGYILLAEELLPSASECVLEDQDTSDEALPVSEPPIIADLRDLAFKLRSHTENEDSEQALGVELGMQRAADMVENLIRRHTEGD